MHFLFSAAGGVLVIFILAVINYYIGRRGWQHLGRHIPFLNKWVYGLAFFLLVFTFPFGEMGEELLPQGIMKFVTYTGGYYIVAMIYFLAALLIIDIIRLLDKKLRFLPAIIRGSARTPVIVSLTVLTLVIAVIAYGAWNAENPVVNRYNLVIHKKAVGPKQLRIVMVSDIHLGNIVGPDRLRSMVTTVNQLKPDLIVLAGDMVDQSIEPGEAQIMSGILGNLQAKYGKFAVPGNHDHFGNQIDSIAKYFAQAGVTVLRDQSIKAGDSFYVIGRENARQHEGESNRRDLSDLVRNTDSSLPVILVDHQPVDIDNAARDKVDIQLSGHTHHGQFFPFNLITERIFKDDWGLLKIGNYNLVVSCGFGTWGPPVRIGNHPEIVEINARIVGSE